MDDLVRELKSRFTCLVMIGLTDDDDGVETIVTWRQGGRTLAIGMPEDFKQDLLQASS